MRIKDRKEIFRWVECPRDSWQGFAHFIPTQDKRAYLGQLLDAGFAYLDLTSFVSPKWVPQMADAEALLQGLPRVKGCEYLAIVANQRGLERALAAPHLSAVGYPFSICETFQRKNTNRSIQDSWPLVAELALKTKGKLKPVVYLSMGFGNPYGDPWSPGLVIEAISKLRVLGVHEIAIADTYGVASARTIEAVLRAVVAEVGPGGIGAHLHSRPEETLSKVDAVLEAGVEWLEGSLAGIGGCPFAGDDLVGNLATEWVLPHLAKQGIELGVNLDLLAGLAHQAAGLKAKFA
jgi:hydroxymethylglutaryl-CoA lyase